MTYMDDLIKYTSDGLQYTLFHKCRNSDLSDIFKNDLNWP